MKIITATGNKNKIREFSQILVPLGFEPVSPETLGIDIDPEETGETFLENAYIKAEAFMKASLLPAIADDSGLSVDALGGAPGVYSARYAKGSDSDRCAKLLRNLENVTDRSAHFVSAVAIVFPDGRKFDAVGKCSGEITYAPAGENGFGYDPVFFLPEFNKTMAEISADQKNSISHRGKALRLLAEKLEKYNK